MHLSLESLLVHARPRWPGSWVSTDLCTPLTRALATWMGISAAPNLQLFSKLVFTRLSFALTSRSNLALCWSVKAINYAVKKNKTWLLVYLKITE